MSRSIRISPPVGGLAPSAPKRANSPRCAECPHWMPHWCKVLARPCAARAAMCEYGLRKRASAAAAKCAAKRRAADFDVKENNTNNPNNTRRHTHT